MGNVTLSDARASKVIKITDAQLRDLLLDSFCLGMNYSSECDIENHTTIIGYSNPYGSKTASEVFSEWVTDRFKEKKVY